MWIQEILKDELQSCWHAKIDTNKLSNETFLLIFTHCVSSEVNICLFLVDLKNGKTFLSKTNEQSLKEYPDMQFSLVLSSDAKIPFKSSTQTLFQNSKLFTDNYQISLINHSTLSQFDSVLPLV